MPVVMRLQALLRREDICMDKRDKRYEGDLDDWRKRPALLTEWKAERGYWRRGDCRAVLAMTG